MAVPQAPLPPGPYYVYPYSPPPQDNSRLTLILVLVVVFAVILPLILAAILYVMVSELLGSPASPGPIPIP